MIPLVLVLAMARLQHVVCVPYVNVSRSCCIYYASSLPPGMTFGSVARSYSPHLVHSYVLLAWFTVDVLIKAQFKNNLSPHRAPSLEWKKLLGALGAPC